MKKIHFQLLIILIILSLSSCKAYEPRSNPIPQISSYPGVATPLPTPNPGTITAEALITTTQSYFLAATLTAIPRPTPSIQPTDIFSRYDSVCFIDPSLLFSLVIAPGWYASSIGGYSVILYNYDYKNITMRNDVFLTGGMKVTIDVLDTVSGKNFDQLVADRIRNDQQAAENRLILTNPISYTLGSYSGVTFSARGYGPDLMEILLHSGDRIAIIGLMPANSSALPQAMSILGSLDLSGSGFCKK